MAPDRPTGLIGEISARPGAFFRFAIGLCRVITFVFGLRLELRGAEHLPRDARGRPAGGWMAVPVPHRRWIDPFLLLLLLPIEPRLAFFADGRVLVKTRLRRLLFRLLGGMVPVWPRGGAKAFGAHIEAARQVLEAGAVFVIFPEAGPPSPPDRTRPIEPGFGYLAMRTGVPLVPMVIGGTGELYRGRRLILSVLPATTPQELAGRPAGAALPEPGSHEERDARDASPTRSPSGWRPRRRAPRGDRACLGRRPQALALAHPLARLGRRRRRRGARRQEAGERLGGQQRLDLGDRSHGALAARPIGHLGAARRQRARRDGDDARHAEQLGVGQLHPRRLVAIVVEDLDAGIGQALVEALGRLGRPRGRARR